MNRYNLKGKGISVEEVLKTKVKPKEDDSFIYIFMGMLLAYFLAL